MTENINQIVKAAQDGDEAALAETVRSVQDRVYRLAMRMLVNPDDAMEATQEILILVVTKLSTFKHESMFHTWVYRVAANYLVNAKKVIDRDLKLDFEMFRADTENGLVMSPVMAPDDTTMLNELRISCTMAMLLCLDRNHRIAFVLGYIFEFEHSEAAEILDISKANFRKRLSRARTEVEAFTAQTCGIVNDNAKCSCPRRLPAAKALGRVVEGRTAYALKDAPDYNEVVAQARRLELSLRTLKLQRATPEFKSPEDLGERITRIVASSAL